MTFPAKILPLLPVAVLVEPSPEDVPSDQPEDDVCANYHIHCAHVEQDQTPIIMPNYIELV